MLCVSIHGLRTKICNLKDIFGISRVENLQSRFWLFFVLFYFIEYVFYLFYGVTTYFQYGELQYYKIHVVLKLSTSFLPLDLCLFANKEITKSLNQLLIDLLKFFFLIFTSNASILN